MPLLLCLDTSNENAAVCLYENGKIITKKINTTPREHAQWLHISIQELLHNTNVKWQEIDAFAFVNGPGSYTGLRIGLSSIKGLCFALQKPLIALNTLDVFANLFTIQQNEMLVTSIDARRNEVFIAIYNHKKEYLLKPQAFILNENLFHFNDNKHNILCVGNGTKKIIDFFPSLHLQEQLFNYEQFVITMAKMSEQYYLEKHFCDINTLESFYLKETFINPISSK